MLAGAVVAAASLPSATLAQAVTDDWASAKIPLDPPPVKAVTVDPKTTALALLDFNKQGCTLERRPRCVADIPKLTKLLADARARGMFVFQTLAGTSTAADLLPELAPRANEPVYGGAAGPDKFIGAPIDLQRVLTDRGIKTLIVAGTGATGAELYMVSAAATRGFTIVVPVDGMPGDSATIEAFAVWEFAHAPRISDRVVLTKTDLISYATP